jgi:hypothetical protein
LVPSRCPAARPKALVIQEGVFPPKGDDQAVELPGPSIVYAFL